MDYQKLSSTVKIKTVSEDLYKGVFEVEGLYTGYGLTVGNALRRTLLSSIPGAAVTQVKIKNAPHEFSVLNGVKEDVLEISLNFKNLRFRMLTDEPQVLTVKAKGEQEVTGKDIKLNSQVELLNPEVKLATLTSKSAVFEAEITVEKGLGYSPVENRKTEKVPIGAILLDAFFSPVKRVNYTVENMRVGESTTYNRLTLEIETDGTVSPSSALHKAVSILKDTFEKIGEMNVQEFEVETKKSKK